MPYIIYADLECLVKRTEGCENNPETSSTTKVGKHTPVDTWCQQFGDLNV